MKADITDKILECLQLEVVSEKDVVYLLVESYKLIELQEVKSDFKTLVFYRNWAVHSKIDHKTEFKEMLREIFKDVHLPEKQISYDVFNFVDFALLKKDIQRFCEQFIGTDVLTGDYFRKFKKSLIQVIADIPIHLEYNDEVIKLSFEQDGELTVKGPGSHLGHIAVHG